MGGPELIAGFFRCTAWRSAAENLSRTLRKGMRVFVAGKLVQRTWQDDAGFPLSVGSFGL